MKLIDLFEAYREVSSTLKGIDRDFANWAMNEIPPGWTREKQQEVKQIFGNVPVGKIYRGIKINSENLLMTLKQLEQRPGKIEMNLASATPEYDTAVSFANYVKSYDELTMMRMLSRAIERGSAGAFGVAVLTLEPTPEQVIVKSYSDRNEREFNPKWRAPKSSAEAEVLLTGDISVVGVKIIPPLTTENWRNIINNTVTTVQQVEDWQLLDQWFRSHKIPNEEVQEFAFQLWPRIIKTKKDLVDALNCERLYSDLYILSQPKLMKELSKIIVMTETDRGWKKYHAVIDGKEYDINRNLHVAYKAYMLGSQTQNGVKTRNIDLEWAKWKNELEQTASKLKTPGQKWRIDLDSIHAIYKINEFKRKVPSRGKDVQQYISAIENNIIEQLKYEIYFIQNVHKDPKSFLSNRYEYGDRIRNVIQASIISKQTKKLLSTYLNSLYYMIPKGTIDTDKAELISWYSREFPTISARCLEVIRGNN